MTHPRPSTVGAPQDPIARCLAPISPDRLRNTGHRRRPAPFLLTTNYPLLTPPFRLTKLRNFSQLPQTTPLPRLTFERYHSIISLDSNIISCYHLPCFARIPPNFTLSPSSHRGSNHPTRTTLFLNSPHQYHSKPLTLPFVFILLRTLLPRAFRQLISFQSLPHSLPKTPGWGYASSNLPSPRRSRHPANRFAHAPPSATMLLRLLAR